MTEHGKALFGVLLFDVTGWHAVPALWDRDGVGRKLPAISRQRVNTHLAGGPNANRAAFTY